MATQDTIMLSKEYYEKLLEDECFLKCLRNAGVDNWNGYDYAVEEFVDAQSDE